MYSSTLCFLFVVALIAQIVDLAPPPAPAVAIDQVFYKIRYGAMYKLPQGIHWVLRKITKVLSLSTSVIPEDTGQI